MKKWLYTALAGVVLTPIIAFSWKNIQAVWATPEKLSSVESKVEKQATAQDQIAKLVVEQQARIEKNEAVYQANLESTKEQLQLIADLKKRK